MSEERGEYQHGNVGNQNAAKPEEEQKSASIQLYCTQDRKAELQEKARAAGMSMSEWILQQVARAEGALSKPESWKLKETPVRAEYCGNIIEGIAYEHWFQQIKPGQHHEVFTGDSGLNFKYAKVIEVL